VTVGTKRENLEEILDHIQLQVDNPMTILTQDTARQFLGNSSAEDKYKLFMKGVQLSQLDADYSIVEEQISVLMNTVETKETALSELKSIYDEWKVKLDIFKRSAEIDGKVKGLTGQYVWSQVFEKEEVRPG
jgi:structural maintenance of chromosomes protein 6